jgi:hypothetical protein
MPALSAATMIIEFFGTCIGLPSISMLTRSGAVGVVGWALMRHLRGSGALKPSPSRGGFG